MTHNDYVSAVHHHLREEGNPYTIRYNASENCVAECTAYGDARRAEIVAGEVTHLSDGVSIQGDCVGCITPLQLAKWLSYDSAVILEAKLVITLVDDDEQAEE